MKNVNKSIGLTIALTTMMILYFTRSHAQISVQAGAGYKQTLAGQLGISYQFKQFEMSTVMLSLPFRKATYFSQNIGYAFTSDDWQVKPYLGASYKMTGNHATQDRYISNGTTTVLKSGQEVNKWSGTFGLLAVKGVGFIDVNYTAGWSAAIGLRYSFKQL